jgi:hypothetical protein
MSPPDLYRSEAFAEDLPDSGYVPLALRPARPQASPGQRAQGVMATVRTALAWRGLRALRPRGGGAVQVT